MLTVGFPITVQRHRQRVQSPSNRAEEEMKVVVGVTEGWQHANTLIFSGREGCERGRCPAGGGVFSQYNISNLTFQPQEWFLYNHQSIWPPEEEQEHEQEQEQEREETCACRPP